jgi:ribulose-5-phosphate 4-epimerase/fuculose-1-phosphate aldolase
LDPEFFIPVDLQSAQVIGPLAVVPSLEMPVHLGAYRAVPEALCVVHTHPPHLVAASRSGEPLVFRGEEMQKPLGSADHLQILRIPVIKNVTPGEMPAMAERTRAVIVAGVPMLVLASHGVYAWGRTPLEALAYVEAAEFLCQTQVTT